MTKWHMLLLAAAASVAVSCAKEDSSDIEITVTDNTVHLIPSDTSSCLSRQQAQAGSTTPAKDVSAYYFPISSALIKLNKRSAAFRIFRVTVTMTSRQLQGKVNCVFDEDELRWAFGTFPGTPWDLILDRTTASKQVNGDCVSLKCGGVKLASEDGSFSGTARVTLDGAELSANRLEEVFAVRSTTTINVEKSF